MTRRASETERQTHNNGVKVKQSDTGNTKNCCKNGGFCIMNSFCYCKQQYYGRYCEHRVRHRSCGTISHGTWMTAACNLCHCFDGRMICTTSMFPNCGETFNHGIEKEPDYSGGTEKQFEEYDKFYDDYVEYNSGTLVTNCHILWGLSLSLAYHWYGIHWLLHTLHALLCDCIQMMVSNGESEDR